MAAGQSNFNGDGSSLDTTTTLATGAKVASTTLAAGIDDATGYLTFSDPIDAMKDGGAILIDDEIVHFFRFDSDYPTELDDCERGKEGTSAASHSAGASVVIVGQAKYHNPSMISAVIAMQETINDLLARVAALESA